LPKLSVKIQDINPNYTTLCKKTAYKTYPVQDNKLKLNKNQSLFSSMSSYKFPPPKSGLGKTYHINRKTILSQLWFRLKDILLEVNLRAALRSSFLSENSNSWEIVCFWLIFFMANICNAWLRHWPYIVHYVIDLKKFLKSFLGLLNKVTSNVKSFQNLIFLIASYFRHELKWILRFMFDNTTIKKHIKN
jgi:hypothetical protein